MEGQKKRKERHTQVEDDRARVEETPRKLPHVLNGGKIVRKLS